MTKQPMVFNAWQKAVVRDYGDGVYAHLADKAEITTADLDDCGDNLFRFLMIELASSEGCDSVREAMRRCERAVWQIDKATEALDAL